LISISASSPGSYSLEKSDLAALDLWREVLSATSVSFFIDEISSVQEFYRVKAASGDTFRLGSSIIPLSNFLISFQLLPGWEHQLQMQDLSFTWTNVLGGALTNSPYLLSNTPANHPRITRESPVPHHCDSSNLPGKSRSDLRRRAIQWGTLGLSLPSDSDIKCLLSEP